MIWREPGQQAHDTFQESDLKICQLCGALNLIHNSECFVCRWHGSFDTRPELVRVAMDILKRSYGTLTLDTLTDGAPYLLRARGGLRGWLALQIARTRHWLFG